MKELTALIICLVVILSTTTYAVFFSKEEKITTKPRLSYDYVQHNLYTTDTVVINTTYHLWYMVGGKELIHHKGCRNITHKRNN